MPQNFGASGVVDFMYQKSSCFESFWDTPYSWNISVCVCHKEAPTQESLTICYNYLGIQVEAWPGPGNSRCGCHRGHRFALATWWVMARWMRRVVVCSASVKYNWMILTNIQRYSHVVICILYHIMFLSIYIYICTHINLCIYIYIFKYKYTI